MLFFLFNSPHCFSQGLNHTWLLSYNYGTSDKARINFTTASSTLIAEQRKIPFEATEGNISTANGDYLMSSNGIWIANANNDTMQNGSGLNPSPFTSNWYPYGLPIPNGNLILPYPGDSTKYALFHQTGDSLNNNIPSTELYYSVIDMNLDGGLGGVDSLQKNIILFHDTISWGLGACKHANGRDWWIVALKDSSDIIFKILLTPNGISSISSEHLNTLPYTWGNATQPTFSPDGTKFSYSYAYVDGAWKHDVRLFNFDRCTGSFSNPLVVDLTDSLPGSGVAFSANSKYLYACSFMKIFQLNTDTSDIAASLKIVALNDTFYSPFPPFQTNFLLMYLAANGKIYLTSSNSVLALHFIDYPDSSGIACGVQQHALPLSCWHERAVPNHPNYYLGSVSGSICDSLGLSIQELEVDFDFNLFPNPTNGNFIISYLLPKNNAGKLEIFDVNGKIIYSMILPAWSTLQQIQLKNIADGIYQCTITSGIKKNEKKIAIINQ